MHDFYIPLRHVVYVVGCLIRESVAFKAEPDVAWMGNQWRVTVGHGSKRRMMDLVGALK